MTATADPPAPGRILIVPSDRWAETAATEIASALGEAISGRGRASLALSGGSTPVPVYALLAEDPTIDWAAVEVFFADERFVPADDPASNYRLVRETLLDRLGGERPTVHFAGRPVDGPLPPGSRARQGSAGGARPDAPGARRASEPSPASLEAAAARYASALPVRLDVLVLGIGEDGHTASLFPGDDRLRSAEGRESDQRPAEATGLAEGRGFPRATAVSNARKPPARRITLSPNAILSARRTVVLARGAAKADAVREALQGAWRPVDCPAQLARGGVWLLDDLAAARL